MRSYSLEFKKKALKEFAEAFPMPLKVFSRQIGVPFTTIRGWIKNEDFIPMSSQNAAAKSKFLPEEKLDLISTYKCLSEDEKGLFLRKKGLYSYEIENFEKELIMAKDNPETKKLKEENRKLKKKTLDLEKKLKKKDRDLAEADALLIMKKKLETLFGEEGEENSQ